MAKEKITRICQFAPCGKTFEPKRNTLGKFCSLKCARRGKSAKSYRQCLDENGDVRHVHRMRAEAALGHPLPKGAIVHHADGTKSEHSQLVICQNQAYHGLLHHRMRIKEAGGNPNKDAICGRCKLVLPLTDFRVNIAHPHGYDGMCKSCVRAYDRERWLRRP